MSDFFDRWNRRHPKLDAEFGQRLRAVPQIPGRYVEGVSDPERPAFEFRGILDHRVRTTHSQGWHARAGDRPDVVVDGSRIDVAVSALLFPLRKGDVVQALEEDGQPSYTVVDVEPSGLGRVTMKVARA